MALQKIITANLFSISIIGIIGIQIGNPNFFVNAVVIESVFVTLAVLSIWKLRYIAIPNIIIAAIVIVGNTAAPRHIEIMSSGEPLENAIVLIVGGYILQFILLIANTIFIKNQIYKKQKQIKT